MVGAAMNCRPTHATGLRVAFLVVALTLAGSCARAIRAEPSLVEDGAEWLARTRCAHLPDAAPWEWFDTRLECNVRCEAGHLRWSHLDGGICPVLGAGGALAESRWQWAHDCQTSGTDAGLLLGTCQWRCIGGEPIASGGDGGCAPFTVEGLGV